jgi:hypothetical protein
VLTVFAAVFSLSNGMIYDCQYQFHDFGIAGNLYTCESRKTDSGGGSNVYAITGYHLAGKSNYDVEGFTAYHHSGEVFPNNLHNFFQNLKALDWLNSKVDWIDPEYFRPFRQLKYLRVQAAGLRILSPDLFQHTPFIQVISFSHNQLLNTGQNILRDLSYLEDVWFEGNSCIDQNAFTWTAIQRLNADLNVRCQYIIEPWM